MQRTRASQHCTDYYLHGCAKLNHELKYYMAVAAEPSCVSEGVLNNIMDDDRLLRNNPNCWKSLFQDVCFVENVPQFTLARLAALVRGETTAGLLSSDARCPCCACVQRVHGDEVLWRHEQDVMGAVPRRYRFQLDLLGSSRG